MVDKKKKVLGAGGVAMTPNEATEAARKNAFASVPKVQNPSGGSNVGIKKSAFNREDVLSRAMSGQNVPSTREIELANLSPEERANLEQSRTQRAALFIAKRNLEREQLVAQAEQEALTGVAPEQILAAQNLGTLTPEQEALNVVPQEPIMDTASAGIAGVAGGVTGGLAGAAVGTKLGALAGTAIAPGVGTAIGAVGGAIIGLAGGVFSKVTLDKRQDVKSAFTNAKQSKNNMQWIINQVNSGKMSYIDASILWDDELAVLRSSEENLHQLNKNEMARFLSGGADEEAAVNAFIRRVPELQLQLQQAILNPDPSKVYTDYASETEDLL